MQLKLFFYFFQWGKFWPKLIFSQPNAWMADEWCKCFLIKKVGTKLGCYSCPYLIIFNLEDMKDQSASYDLCER